MLKNLTLYKLDGEFGYTPGKLEEILMQHRLVAPSALQSSSRGWVPVGPGGEFVFSTEKQMLFCAGIETKVIPSSALRRAIKAEADNLEKVQGFKPGRKQLRDLKDKVLSELLAKAMTKLDETRVWIDAMNGYLAIDTTSAKKADEITAMLRDHLDGSLKISMPDGEISPASLMAKWLVSGKAGPKMGIGESAEMVSSDGKKATVKFARHDIVGCTEVTTHVEMGKTVSKLALTWNDAAEFTLTDKMQIKGIRYMEPESAEEAGEKDAAMLFEADFRLTTYALQGIVNGLSDALGFRE